MPLRLQLRVPSLLRAATSCLLLLLALTGLAVSEEAAGGAEGSYLLVEVPLRDGLLGEEARSLVKRQVQYEEQPATPAPRAGPAQYVQQPSQAQISPEFYAYLQQVHAAQYQAAAQQQQQQQNIDLNQVLSARGPQRFDQPPLPGRAPPVPEDQRRLQETLKQTKIREQEREDQTNQQLIAAGLNPTQVRVGRLRASAQRLAAQQAEEAALREAAGFPAYPPQLVFQPRLYQFQQQEVPVAAQVAESSTPVPERLSYSQVAFGTTRLPQPAPGLVPGKTQQFIYTAPGPQPQPQAVLYKQPQQQGELVYQPQYVYSSRGQPVQRRPASSEPAGRAPVQYVFSQPQQGESEGGEASSPTERPRQLYQPVLYRPAASVYQQSPPPRAGPRLVYQSEPPRSGVLPSYRGPQQQGLEAGAAGAHQERVVFPQAEVTQKQTPDQYLIETTRPQQSVQQQEVSYQTALRSALLAQQQQEEEETAASHQPLVSSTPPPSSAIYVTTARSTLAKQRQGQPAEQRYAYRTGNELQQRPLTQSELDALINAGFTVQDSPYAHPAYYRSAAGLSKRQQPLRPARIGKVQLTTDEKESLANKGIRGLYRIQQEPSEQAPSGQVTYVLALASQQKRDTQESTSST